MLKRVPIVLAVSAAAALGAAPSASATNMTPLVTCVETTAQGYVAHFGYRNDTGSTVVRTVARSEGKNHTLNLVYNGKDNEWWTLTDAQVNRGQPTTFLPGQHDDVFTVAFDSGDLTWGLVGRKATANASSPACQPAQPKPDPQPEPGPAPTPTPVPAAGTPVGTTQPTTGAAKRTCTSRRVLTIRIRERKGQKVRSARVVFQNKTIAVSRRTTDGRVVAKIDFRKLPSGRFSVQIRAKLTNGKTRTYTRKYYTCKPKFGSANNLGSKTAL